MSKLAEKKLLRRSKTDIGRDNDMIEMRLEMPGVSKENLSVNVDGNRLVIEGKKEELSQDGKWIVKEIQSEDYHLEYSIDETIDRNSIEASLNQGVLILKLGLSESVKPKKIKVISH